jgi:DNA polymerase III epsilon subunit-like protein
MQKKLCILDCETTGLKDPRLLQLAFCYNNGPISAHLFKPTVDIEKEAEKAHGITAEQLQHYDTVEHTRESLQRALDPESTIIICHNTSYDLRVLANEGIDTGDSICTLKLSRRLWPQLKSHKLGDLAETLGIEHGRLHSAPEDVRVTRELFKRQIMSIICKDLDKSSIIQRMIGITAGSIA